jgi:hypothetical protein
VNCPFFVIAVSRRIPLILTIPFVMGGGGGQQIKMFLVQDNSMGIKCMDKYVCKKKIIKRL